MSCFSYSIDAIERPIKASYYENKCAFRILLFYEMPHLKLFKRTWKYSEDEFVLSSLCQAMTRIIL